jgi:outer membrane protein assembly factor BamB
MNTVLFVAIAALCARPANPSDWPQWAGPLRDFGATKVSLDEKADFAAIRKVWSAPCGSGNSGIVVGNGTAFTMYHNNGKEFVIALSLKDGKPIWKREFAVKTGDFMDLEFGLGPHSTPLIAQQRLFCVGLTGRLSALDVKTGETIWQKELWENGKSTKLERGFAASPVAFEDAIIVPVGGKGQSIQSFAVKDGRLLWQKHDFVSAYASPLVTKLVGRSQLIAYMDQNLVGLHPQNGRILWQHPIPTVRYVNCTSPLVASNNVIVVNTCDGLRGLQLSVDQGKFSIREMWSNRTTICQTTNFVVRDDTIYGAKEGSAFSATDASSGKTLWNSRQLKDCSVIAVGKLLIMLQENGELAIAKATSKGLTVLWRRDGFKGRCWAGPVVVDGLLLVRDARQIVAFKLP